MGLRRTVTLLVVPALGLGLAACDAEPESSPEEVAGLVARAIADGDFTAVPLVEGSAQDAARARQTAYEGLSDLPVTAEVVEVRELEEVPRAEARLAITWDLPGDDDPVREVSLRLRRVEDEWFAVWEHGLLGVPSGRRLVVEETQPERADVLDRNGEPLLTERPVVRFGIDKTRVTGEAEQAAAARALAEAAGIDPGPYADQVAAAGPQAFVELITYRAQDPNGQELRRRVQDIDGAVAIDDTRVLGPTRTFAQPLLGTVGPVTAEMVEQDPDRYQPGDVAGLSGLAAALEDRVTGQPGVRLVEVQESDGARLTVAEQEPQPAEPVRVSLDIELQEHAEEVLADVEPPSALVAIHHPTGEVVAMANGPGSQGRDTALAAQYAPGSTFKLVTALALLRAGMTPESTVHCSEELVVDGYVFHNVPGYAPENLGEITLSEAIAHSCNTALIAERDRVPMDALAQAAADLGLGATWGMPVTAFSGSVPDEAVSDTEHAANLIGQGRVLASPTAMAAVAATIARGEIVIPRVLTEEPPPEVSSGLTPKEAEGLRQLMRAVVTDGAASMLADNPGGPVMAKTGTAEYGTESPPRTHAWMIAIQDELAVAVFVEDGRRGSEVAGPLVDRFLTLAAGETD